MQDIERAVLRDTGLGKATRLVWLELLARCHGLGQAAVEVSQDELCQAVGITPKTLRSTFAELSMAGLLVVTRQHRKSVYEPLTPVEAA